VVGHAGEIAAGEKRFSRGFSPSFGRGVLPAPGRVRAKKSSGPAAASADIAGCSCRGPEQHSYSTPYSRAKGCSPASSRAFRAGGGTTRAQPSRLTPLLGFSRRFAGRVLLTDLSFSGESPSPARRSSRVRWHGTSLRRPGRTRPGLDRPGSPGRGSPAPGQARVAVHEGEDLFVSERTWTPDSGGAPTGTQGHLASPLTCRTG
jgi:hypothetical protein